MDLSELEPEQYDFVVKAFIGLDEANRIHLLGRSLRHHGFLVLHIKRADAIALELVDRRCKTASHRLLLLEAFRGQRTILGLCEVDAFANCI